MITKCIDHLNPGGKLIIRDGDNDIKDRHKRTKLTEYFSTSLFKFNKTTNEGLCFFSGSMIRTMAAERNMECNEMADSKLTSNTFFILTAATKIND